jgi:type IV pilus assembly protein PilC
MASFKYIALTTSGKERKGSVQAPDANAATATLREQGLFIVKISDESKAEAGLSQEFNLDSLNQYRSVSRTQLVFFFKQLSFMLRAGLPILQALQLSQTQVSSGRLKLVIGEMLVDIENGYQLSKAMEKHRDVFPTIAVNLMAAGESTGSLDSVANRLATHLEKKAALRSQTINAMIYPTVVLIVALGVVIFLVVSIIPKFAKFLLGQGKALPASTQFLIDASDFALKYGIFIAVAFAFCIISLIVAYKTPLGRLKLDAFSLKIPVVGNLLLHGIMAEFNWSLSMMLRSGLTALESLRISGKVISNRLISDKLFMAADQILTGKDLASSLKHPAIPDLVIQMTSMGEKTGTLDQVLQEVGSFYEEQLQVGVKRMSAMIEPAMILIIGGIVGFVYYAFFQAMFSLVSKG